MVRNIWLVIIIRQIVVINKNSKRENVFVDKIKNLLIPQIAIKVPVPHLALARYARFKHNPYPHDLHILIVIGHNPMPLPLVNNKKRADHISAGV